MLTNSLTGTIYGVIISVVLKLINCCPLSSSPFLVSMVEPIGLPHLILIRVEDYCLINILSLQEPSKVESPQSQDKVLFIFDEAQASLSPVLD